jgi:hypothetical protein
LSPFEYVMVLVSIVIGLAITHLLSSVAEGVHRLRGHGEPLSLDPVYLLWVGYVLVWLVSFWWYEFNFQALRDEWTFGLYLFVISFAILLFLLAAILVPHRLNGVQDSYRYFMEGRRWFFGANIAGVIFDVFDTLLKGAGYSALPSAMWMSGVYLLASLAGLFSSRRTVQLFAAATSFTLQLVYMFQQLGVLGGE